MNPLKPIGFCGLEKKNKTSRRSKRINRSLDELNNFNLFVFYASFIASYRFGSSTRRSYNNRRRENITEIREGCFAPNEEREQYDTELGSRIWSAYLDIRAGLIKETYFPGRLIHEADRPDLGASPFGRRPEVNRDTVPSDVPSGAFLPLRPRNASHTIFRAVPPPPLAPPWRVAL